ncbi:hypothetical protein [Acidovorax sp. M2(2025)]|uniref:hypothetical protein n=1 Tax=Acidovorax sp. M2(2025) TaxID=3411355 RepID=UPI003BF4B531
MHFSSLWLKNRRTVGAPCDTAVTASAWAHQLLKTIQERTKSMQTTPFLTAKSPALCIAIGMKV